MRSPPSLLQRRTQRDKLPLGPPLSECWPLCPELSLPISGYPHSSPMRMCYYHSHFKQEKIEGQEGRRPHRFSRTSASTSLIKGHVYFLFHDIQVHRICCLISKAFQSEPWDFPGSPVVKNPASKSRDASSTPGREMKIPHATGQLSPQTANYRAHTFWNFVTTTTEKPTHQTKTLHVATKPRHS